MTKRKKERLLIRKDVIINDILKAFALDISEGGMYIHTQAEFILGALLELSFDIDEGPIKVKARVQHMQTGIGMGVKFVDLSEEDFMRIKKLLKRLPLVSPVKVPGKKEVLLVDDEEKTRSVYKMRLFQDGFTVIEVCPA